MSIDLVIRGGLVADGTGEPLRQADVAIEGDRVALVGNIPDVGCPELRADYCVVAPGFINVLSHAYGTLQQDPRGLSDLYQGVTTEVFGEGYSLGPVSGRLAEIAGNEPQETGLQMSWPRLRDFLEHLSATGVGPNVASFVGASNLRMIHAGAEDRPLTDEELSGACELLDAELAAGALGLGSALIYSPGCYASTSELTAYARVLARHDALYASHIRDEADRLIEAIGELVHITRTAQARAEIFHLKASAQRNWPKMAEAIETVERARAEGLQVSADVYPYKAGATRLAACIPPRFHAGGQEALLARLADEAARGMIKDAIARPSADWQNLYLDAGGAEGVLLLGDPQTDHGGRTLAEVMTARHDIDPIDTLLDLVSAEPKLPAAYFGMSEQNIRLVLERPWVSVGSDAEAPAAEPPFTGTPTHPRTYGSFARVLGHYVREGVLPIEEAIRRMSSLPAHNLRLADRGVIREGAFADVSVFDPQEVRDLATYESPHAYATGMRHVLINGAQAFKDGRPTGTLAGRALRRAR